MSASPLIPDLSLLRHSPSRRYVNKPLTKARRDCPTAPLTPSSYVLGRLLRTSEKYVTAKAASNTPPTIKIKVVTIAQFSSAASPERKQIALRTARSADEQRGLALGAFGCFGRSTGSLGQLLFDL